MTETTRNQIGSPSRDQFKRRHKDLNRQLYALDLDFVLVEKDPTPDIVAVLDYKNGHGDLVTFSEVIAYNALLRRGLPVFIISGCQESGTFEIWRWLGGHHLKPTKRCEKIAATTSWAEFEQWEVALRLDWRERYSP